MGAQHFLPCGTLGQFDLLDPQPVDIRGEQRNELFSIADVVADRSTPNSKPLRGRARAR